MIDAKRTAVKQDLMLIDMIANPCLMRALLRSVSNLPRSLYMTREFSVEAMSNRLNQTGRKGFLPAHDSGLEVL